ncbi:hypothetical protein E2C01_069517 [Portunus trituberculatus]|uniref:Uncharacterized protein n=1 Tax=Portunus trituberculatus TaxID=210409 RepID=A0A5B7HUR3_PORTR|nr:hypothetical protein [Portunus trituberculatus]
MATLPILFVYRRQLMPPCPPTPAFLTPQSSRPIRYRLAPVPLKKSQPNIAEKSKISDVPAT